MAGSNIGTDKAARREREATFLGRLLTDPWRKLVALGLGMLCWLGIRSTFSKSIAEQHWFVVENVKVTVPAAALNGAERYYFAQGATVGNVSLDVAVDFWHQGTEIKPSDFRMELPLDTLAFEDDGRRTEPLQREYTLVVNDIREKPSEVEVRQITPKTIKVRWDKYVSREVPVHANVNNWLPGNRTVQTTVTPAVVTVTGPAFMVNQITAVQTAEFDLRNDDQGFSMDLDLVPPGFAECTLSTQDVKVTFDIRDNTEIISRRFDNVRVNILNRLDATFEVDRNSVVSDQVSVIVTGTADKVNRMAEEGLGAYCDLTSFSSSGVQNVKVELLGVPSGVKTTVEPSEFLRLKMVPIYSSQGANAPAAAPEGEAKSHAGGAPLP